MSITLYLGNIGAGKTASAVRDLYINPTHREMFSNISTKGIKNNHLINRTMLIKKTVIGIKKNGEEIIKQEFNKDFWVYTAKKYNGISVIIDEAQNLLNARRGMSNTSRCMQDFLTLLRRILGSNDAGYGELIMISQLERKLDVLLKESCNLIKYHLCHYLKTCTICGTTWPENNEISEPVFDCPRCKCDKIKRHSFKIEVWHFKSMDLFIKWKYYGQKTKLTAHRHYYINDIEKYFPLYDSLTWDDLISE